MEKGLRKDAPMQEHSPAEPERSRGLRKEPEQSPSGERTPKGARDTERTSGLAKLHYCETLESSVIARGLDGSLSLADFYGSVYLYGDRFRRAAPGRR